MTIKELYGICDNFNERTLFTIREGYLEKPVVTDETFIELHPKFWNVPITGFRVNDLRSATIYISSSPL